MSSKRGPHDWCNDIFQAASDINADVGDMEKEIFLSDGKTQRAVVKSLSDIGEAAKNLGALLSRDERFGVALIDDLRDAYGMRTILSHEYFRIDPEVVWQTVKISVPSLLLKIEEVSRHLVRNRTSPSI